MKELRILLVLLLCFGFWIATCSAKAQQDTSPFEVRVAPPTVQIDEGQITEVGIEVVDVQELYGFDISLTFDPNVVAVVDADPNKAAVQVTPGTFLEPDLVVVNNADNLSGNLQFVMTQLNPTEAKSGTGQLVSIQLRGVQKGTTTLAFGKAELAQRDGTLLDITLLPGQVEVVEKAGGNITNTPTAIQARPMPTFTKISPTNTPKPTPTGAVPTSTPQPTATCLPATDTPRPTPRTVLPTDALQPTATTAPPTYTPQPTATTIPPTDTPQPSLTSSVALADTLQLTPTTATPTSTFRPTQVPVLTTANTPVFANPPTPTASDLATDTAMPPTTATRPPQSVVTVQPQQPRSSGIVVYGWLGIGVLGLIASSAILLRIWHHMKG